VAEVTETEFRVCYDIVYEGYYVYHAPLHCDWERELGSEAPSFAYIRSVSEEHERECSA
jgi:hypothetical protein